MTRPPQLPGREASDIRINTTGPTTPGPRTARPDPTAVGPVPPGQTAPGPTATRQTGPTGPTDQSGQTAVGVAAPAAGDPAGTSHPLRAALRHPAVPDAAVAATLLAGAGWLTSGLWPAPGTTALALDPGAQVTGEWLLAHATRLFAGQPYLVSPLLNAPDGVNLLGEPALLPIAAVLAPLTLLFGAPATFALILTMNPVATGLGWYLLLSRTVRLHRAAAAMAGALTAFAPGMVAHGNGHPSLTAQWLVPPLIWALIRLVRHCTEPPQVWRTGALLGALLAVQYLLSELVLVVAGVGVVILGTTLGVLHPAAARRALPGLGRGLGLGIGLAALVLAYPLWLRAGVPAPWPAATADLGHLASLSPLSLAGEPGAADLATITTSFGIPLLLVAGGAAIWLWRDRRAIACTATALGLYALAVGGSAAFALGVVAPVAVVLALAVHTALTGGEADGLRLLVPVTVIAALVPLAPRALPVQPREAVPRFFSDGYWRSCVPDGGVLVPAPLPSAARPEPMRWAAAAHAGFALPQGAFAGSAGAPRRPTARLLDDIERTGEVPLIDLAIRATVRADLDHWRASCVALAAAPDRPMLRSTLDTLLGPGTRVVDVWIWRVPDR